MLQCANAAVMGDERRRASCVKRSAWALQAQHERKTPTGDGAGEASRGIHASTRRHLFEYTCKFARPLANINGNTTVEERAPCPFCFVKSRIALLKQLTLLWIHCGCLSGRHRKRAVPKKFRVQQECTVAHSARNLRLGMWDIKCCLLYVPPRSGNYAQKVVRAVA
eukprot:3311099-Prymnesium_polylepis.1